MVDESVGARLRRAIAERGITEAEAARELRVLSQSLSNWLCGHGRPELVAMVKIQRVYGIPVEAWLTPDDLAEIALTLRLRSEAPARRRSRKARPSKTVDAQSLAHTG